VNGKGFKAKDQGKGRYNYEGGRMPKAVVGQQIHALRVTKHYKGVHKGRYWHGRRPGLCQQHTHVSVAIIQVTHLGHPMGVSITTPVVSALKNYYIQSSLEVPADILNHFWIQVAGKTSAA
jgi:hypothetical protein